MSARIYFVYRRRRTRQDLLTVLPSGLKGKLASIEGKECDEAAVAAIALDLHQQLKDAFEEQVLAYGRL